MISLEYYVIWNTETTQYYDHEERGDYYFTDRVNWAWKTTIYARAEKMCKKLNYYNERCKVIKVSMQEVNEPDKKLCMGKVVDEPNEWVLGELVSIRNSQYPHIFQKQEFPWSKCCGVGTFAVEKDSIKEVKI